MVETEGNHNPSKDSQNKVYSQPIFFYRRSGYI
jgi:hypothetical protein